MSRFLAFRDFPDHFSSNFLKIRNYLASKMEVAMPPVAKRRKLEAATTRSLSAANSQKGIQAFGKISKAQLQPLGKRTLNKEIIQAGRPGKSDSNTGSGAKRKSDCLDSTLDKQSEITSTTTGQAPLPGNSSVGSDDDDEHPPHQLLTPPSSQSIASQKSSSSKSTSTETPTKGSSLRLESFTFKSASLVTAGHTTPPSSPLLPASPSNEHGESSGLPEELQDLVNLHSSFLTALSLHYTHNGSMTPADLRNLGPGVERAWRKRKVTTEDVRRILALIRKERADGSPQPGPLYLSDYGQGKICVEITDSPHFKKAQRRPVNEEELNALFVRNLERIWTSHRISQIDTVSPSNFIASLPLLPIIPCSSLSKIAPLLSKGQRRLEDLKAGAIKAQQSTVPNPSAKPAHSQHQRPKPTTSRSSDLLSRIKAKQLHQSTLPLPPSSEVLSRKSALQRLLEVAPIIDSLAASSKKHANDDAVAEIFKPKIPHASFTMPTLVQHLQMSLRNPIGKEEAVSCVRLLAEVAPEWVGVREVGRMIGVTVRGAGVGRGEMGRRIGGLMERL